MSVYLITRFCRRFIFLLDEKLNSKSEVSALQIVSLVKKIKVEKLMDISAKTFFQPFIDTIPFNFLLHPVYESAILIQDEIDNSP